MAIVTVLTLDEQLQVIAEKVSSPRKFTNRELAEKFNTSLRTIQRINVNDKPEILKRIKGISGEQKLKGIKPRKSTPKVETAPATPSPDRFANIDWNDPEQVSFIITSNNITMNVEGIGDYVAKRTDENYKEIFEALSHGDTEKAFFLLNRVEAIHKATEGAVTYQNGKLTCAGTTISGKLLKKVNIFADNGNVVGFTSLLKFLDKCDQNPEYRAIRELYDFLEANDIKIDEDGDVIAFKYVTHDFKDCRTGDFDNSVGSVVKMRRRDVNNNPNVTCAQGLHACSIHYLNKWSSSYEKVVKVKINPRDVVAIPIDYNNAKMRCCEYKVIEDVTETWKDYNLK